MLNTTPHPYLTKRNQAYYYRRRIPFVLRALFDRREFTISLKTSNFLNAKKLALRYDDYFDQLIHAETIKTMKLPDRIYGFTVRIDKEGNKDIDFPVDEIIAMRAAGYAPSEINALVQSTIQSAHVGKPEPKKIGENALQPNQVENHLPEKQTTASAPPLLLSQAIVDFHASVVQKKHDPQWKPAANQRSFFRRLLEIVGDKPICDINRKDASDIFDNIKLLPANASSFKGKTVKEIINSSLPPGSAKQTFLSPKSINSHMELYSRLYNWAINEEHTKNTNPFNGFRIDKDKKVKVKNARFPFTRGELDAIFSTPFYTQGKYKHPYQFWIPLIALFSGARRAEIAALHITDIYKDDKGIYVFDFNENIEFKRAKTANSIRKTPVHSFLLNLGLLKFIDACSKANKERLFEELSWNEKEGYGRVVGDWFNGRYLKDLGIHVVNKKVFHSFRHSFATELSIAEVTDPVIEQLSGRGSDEIKTVGQTTYISDLKTPKLLHHLEKLDFSNELKNVKWIEKKVLV